MDFARLDVPNLKAHLRAQDRARFADPNLDPALPRVRLAYVFLAGGWQFVAFVRVTGKLRTSNVRRVRRALKLRASDVLKIVEVPTMLPANESGVPAALRNHRVMLTRAEALVS